MMVLLHAVDDAAAVAHDDVNVDAFAAAVVGDDNGLVDDDVTAATACL